MSTIATSATSDDGYLVVGLMLVVLNLVPVAVCFLKGKPGMAIAGIFIGIVSFVGMIRLAKPGSFYYRRYYVAANHHGGRFRDDAKIGRSHERYPELAAKLDAKTADTVPA